MLRIPSSMRAAGYGPYTPDRAHANARSKSLRVAYVALGALGGGLGVMPDARSS